MQISKELLQNELDQMQARHNEVLASVNKLTGAMLVLKDLLKYLEAEEVREEIEAKEPRQDISKENEQIQARDEAMQAYIQQANDPQPPAHLFQDADEEALTMQEVAEMVAGPGATYEEPQPYVDFPEEEQHAAR